MIDKIGNWLGTAMIVLVWALVIAIATLMTALLGAFLRWAVN